MEPAREPVQSLCIASARHPGQIRADQQVRSSTGCGPRFLGAGGRYLGEVTARLPDEAADRPAVEVRRSRRRRRTVAAYRDGDRVIVLLPARMTRAEEAQWVSTMLERLDKQERRRKPTDGSLQRRARELSRRHLDGLAEPASVRWVDNQNRRWGSCTPADRSIRLSERLQGMPSWVIDYVLVHELAHLIEPGHDKRFWALVDRYPRTERARGYLEGVAAAAGLDLGDAINDVDGPDGVMDGVEDDIATVADDRRHP